jgi:hypothetical protein
MRNWLLPLVGFGVAVLPAWVVAQQASPAPPVAPSAPTPVAPQVPAAAGVAAPETPAPAPAASQTNAPSVPDVTVNIGGAAPKGGGFAPLPNVELPAGMARPSVGATSSAAVAPLLPPVAPAPAAKLTPAQIASQIAPNFNVARDYTRLTQCYGTADFMGAVTRIQASRPGATPQVVNVARSIAALQDGMQPMVLAASTVRGEARFRADYDAIARRGQNELATSRTPNTTMQRRLATLDACRGDVVRWRGGR